MKILVVDDSEAFRKVLAEFLVRAGFHEIAEASNFEQAVEAFRASDPRFTFVDMILPGRSGVDLTKELLCINPGAIIIAMSSIINKKLIQQSLEAGAKDFLLKPTNEIALNSVLTMWSD
ncbi:MAG: response regulator [Methanobacteriota archaeon]|nr:MAG: response regulator [Euryarchaeota archaeon]